MTGPTSREELTRILRTLPDPLFGFQTDPPHVQQAIVGLLRAGTDLGVYQIAATPLLRQSTWTWPGAWDHLGIDPAKGNPEDWIPDVLIALWVGWGTRDAAIRTVLEYDTAMCELGEVLRIQVLPADDCPTCKAQTRPMEIFERVKAGLPPFHPGCRCTMIPVLDL